MRAIRKAIEFGNFDSYRRAFHNLYSRPQSV
jgi:hypothetical protein